MIGNGVSMSATMLHHVNAKEHSISKSIKFLDGFWEGYGG